MKTFKGLLLLLLLFVLFGASGGTLFLLAAKQYAVMNGKISNEQVNHVLAVLQMEPDHFKKVVEDLLKKERKPINDREADLFAERKRLANEWSRFHHDQTLWLQYRDEERTYLRSKRNALDDERKRLDSLRESIEQREKKLADRENAIIGKSYQHWLDSLKKLKPDAIATLIKDRSPEQIAQDLLQLKPSIVGGVLLELEDLKKLAVNQREKDLQGKKINLIKEILRDGGLRLAN